MSAPLLSVRDLRITFGASAAREVVHGLSFDVAQGESFAIVGESGSGKTVTALSIMGLLPRASRITAGSIRFAGSELVGLPQARLRPFRGVKMGMVFQEPMTSLNPVLPIGLQLTEGLATHGLATPAEARRQAITMLERVGMTEPARRLAQYPHEFSGGMRQRVMLAIAMMARPALLIADEPTTALDVTIQAQILDLMRELTRDAGTSLVLITHDMGVVAEMADRVLVMRNGAAVENATATQLFASPREAYTRALLAAVPRMDRPTDMPLTGAEALQPILAARGVTKVFRSVGLGRRPGTRALDNVSLGVMPGETLALVGESGSGKSTLGRALAGLMPVDAGAITLDGEDLAALGVRELRRRRRAVQVIFQDPYASLDPRFTAGRTVAEPMIIHGLAGRREAGERAVAMLRQVGLGADAAGRYPHQFSGGQRQRIAIARALAAKPRVLIADEPTSALDVSVQAQVLDLLRRLREERGISLVFISHDLAVVRQIADRVAVMRSGRVLELGPTEAIFANPAHAYTRALLSAVPLPDPATRNRPRLVASPDSYPAGSLYEIAPRHWVAA